MGVRRRKSWCGAEGVCSGDEALGDGVDGFVGASLRERRWIVKNVKWVVARWKSSRCASVRR